MYRRAVITDEISQDIFTAAALAAKYGLEGLELRSVNGRQPHEFTANDRAQIRSACAEYGLTVCGISSPCFKCDIDSGEEYEKHIEILKKTVELAAEFGVGRVRGFTFWNKGDFAEYLPRIAEKYRRPTELVKAAGQKLVIEHDPSVFAPNAAKLAAVIKEIGSPDVRALWDPGNDIYDPEHERPYPDGYEIIRPYMEHFHLKDAALGADGKPDGRMLGSGAVDIKGQLAALKRDGYNGWAVLETHWRVSREIAEELLKRPGGAQFSEGGAAATELCMAEWNKIEGARP